MAPAPTATAAAAATVSPTKGKSPRKSKESSKYQRLLMASPPSAVERSWNTRTVRKTNNVSPQRSLSFRKKRQQRQEREKLEEEPTTPTRSVTRPKSTSVLVSSTPEPSTASTTSSTPVQPSVPATRSHSKSTTALQTTPTTRDTPPARIARRVSVCMCAVASYHCIYRRHQLLLEHDRYLPLVHQPHLVIYVSSAISVSTC